LAEIKKMKKKIYFASDFHFGIPDRKGSLDRENLFTGWLETVRKDASEIYLMGDLFDFWFEYKTVIPRGYVRLLGKLAEIADTGVKIHLFIGNHDMWVFDYLNSEVHIEIHHDPEFKEFDGKIFYLAHGDGLGPVVLGINSSRKSFRTALINGCSGGSIPTWGSGSLYSGLGKAGLQVLSRRKRS